MQYNNEKGESVIYNTKYNDVFPSVCLSVCLELKTCWTDWAQLFREKLFENTLTTEPIEFYILEKHHILFKAILLPFLS